MKIALIFLQKKRIIEVLKFTRIDDRSVYFLVAVLHRRRFRRSLPGVKTPFDRRMKSLRRTRKMPCYTAVKKTGNTITYILGGNENVVF